MTKMATLAAAFLMAPALAIAADDTVYTVQKDTIGCTKAVIVHVRSRALATGKEVTAEDRADAEQLMRDGICKRFAKGTELRRADRHARYPFWRYRVEDNAHNFYLPDTAVKPKQ